MRTNKDIVADVCCIAGMIVAWTGYYLASDWAVAFTGSAFAAGMLLRAGALVFLTVYLAARKKLGAVFRQGKTALVLLLIGVLGYMLDTFANLGFAYGSVGTGTVLLKTDILMANIVTAVFLKERLYLSDWVSTLVMLGGVILVLDIDFGSAGFNWYDLFFIASAASVTANAFVIKTAQDRLSADSDVIGYYNNFVVLVLFTLSSLIAGDFEALGAVELEVWHVFAFLGGGLAQTLIYVFYYFIFLCYAATGRGIYVLGGAAAIALRGKINRRRMESGKLPSVVYQRESTSKGGNDETYPQR